jgi:predicted acylesterase/phospholipase RssA/CRP-like cAMP-binding protein
MKYVTQLKTFAKTMPHNLRQSSNGSVARDQTDTSLCNQIRKMENEFVEQVTIEDFWDPHRVETSDNGDSEVPREVPLEAPLEDVPNEWTRTTTSFSSVETMTIPATLAWDFPASESIPTLQSISQNDNSSWALSSLVMSLLHFLIIGVPSFLSRLVYNVLAWSWTLSFEWEFTTKNVLFTTLIVSLLIWPVFRYRLLTRYARLPRLETAVPVQANTVWYDTFYDLFSRKSANHNLVPPSSVNVTVDLTQDEPYDNSLLSMFLSGIKVFGFLEKPVFNELSKHLGVRRFAKEGEVVYDWTRSGISSAISSSNPPARDFFIVVEGGLDVWVVDQEEDTEEDCLECARDRLERIESTISLTVDPVSSNPGTFVQTPDLYEPIPVRQEGAIHSSLHEQHAKPRKLHLLHHVSPGSPATSLFTVLSIFCNSLRLPEVETLMDPPTTKINLTKGSRALDESDSDDAYFRVDADLDNYEATEIQDFWQHVEHTFGSAELSPRPLQSKSSQSPMFPGLRTPTASPSPPKAPSPELQPSPLETHLRQKLILEAALKQLETPFYGPQRLVATTSQADTVLAVVPEAAFVKISKNHPRSVGGIVSVILSRFSRCTARGFGSWLGVAPLAKTSSTDTGPVKATMRPATSHHAATVDVAGKVENVTTWTTHEVVQLERRINTLAGEFGGASHILHSRVPQSVWERLLHSQGIGSGLNVGTRNVEVNVPKTPPTVKTPLVTTPGKPVKPQIHIGERTMTEAFLDKPRHAMPPSFHAPKVAHGFAYLLHEPFEEEDERAVKESAVEAFDQVLGTHVDVILSETLFPPQSPSLQSESDEQEVRKVQNGSASLKGKDVELFYFEKGSVLLKEGEKASGIHLILQGSCVATMGSVHAEADDVWADPASPLPSIGINPLLLRIEVGGMVGYLASMTTQPSLVTVTATKPTYTAFISKRSLEKMMERVPAVMLTFGKRLLTHISPLVLHVDFALEWMQASAGQVLCRQGDAADSVFIVLHGRLRSIRERAPDNPDEAPLMNGVKRGYWTAPESPVALDDDDLSTLPNGKGSLAFAAHRASRQRKPIVPEKKAGWFSLSAQTTVDPTLQELAEHERLRQERLLSSMRPHLEVVNEHGAGESVGEIEVLTGLPRTTTIHAIRDTEVAVMSKALFHALAVRHPEITIQFSRIIAMRAAQVNVYAPREDEFMFGSPMQKRRPPPPEIPNSNFMADPTLHSASLCNVAIIPVTEIVPVTEFAEQLQQGLVSEGATVSLLNTASVLTVMGKHAFSRMGKLKLMQWLAEKEETRRMVLYVADGGVSSPWTQRCVRQADCILLVGLGDEEPTLGEFEQLLMGMKTTARKELVLLHNDRYVVPGSTSEWLKLRPWIHAHHHVEMRLGSNPKSEKRITTMGRLARKLAPVLPGVGSAVGLGRRLEPKLYGATSIFNKLGGASGETMDSLNGTDSIIFSADTETGRIRGDFGRVARRLLGKSIGLVLGGGGARGISQVGLLKALEEAEVPIDMVGGTSIGAFVGGLYSRDTEFVSVYGRAKAFAGRMATKWRMAIDLTWPITAWFSGHEFNRGIWKCFSDTHIEDSWIPYFCTTTNITFQRLDIQQTGYMWRYVRASMSLSGFLPPLADNGSMLLDGGYCNNLPADVMRALGADTIIAVDVGARDNDAPVKYGDSLSGWYIWWDRINPFHDKRYQRIPSLAEVQSRLAYVSSVPQLLMAKSMEGCLYLRPPVVQFGTLDFEKFKDIFLVGYEYGTEVVKQWRRDGTLQRMFGVDADGSRIGTRLARREPQMPMPIRRRHVRRNSV